jgi:hypothetical protein
LIDPTTLQTIGQIQISLVPGSAGLDGISAGFDGSTLYVEGPLPSDPHGCCAPYMIDLTTLRAKVAAGIPGSGTRNSLVSSGGVVYPAALTRAGTVQGMDNDLLHLSPNRRWLFGVRNFQGPVLDVFDMERGFVVRRLAPQRLEENVAASGAWAGGHFFLYVALPGALGRLWVVSPETEQLGDGVEVGPIGQAAGCPGPITRAVTTAGGNLFLYELFGFKGDRRAQCRGRVPGGAWMADSATGKLVRQIAPDLHFSALIADRASAMLYGLAPGGAGWEPPVQLVRINAGDGRVLQSRVLDPGFWRIAVVSLRSIPSGILRLDVP